MDRTRTVIARTRGFLSDGRKEDDGADKSAANLTRPFRFVGLWLSRGWNVVVGWLGKWLWSSFIVVEKQLDGRGGKADEGKSRREEKSAAVLPRSFCWFREGRLPIVNFSCGRK